MAPVRTKEKESSSDAKKRQFHKKKQEKDSNALPGVQKIKASLRQTRRLLAKDKLAADVRVATERRLKALEADLQHAELARKERTLAVRYHKIKFFERQKVVRKINQAKKRLASADATLFDLRIDLNYILHYPKMEKYISLFPSEVRLGEARQVDAEAAKTDVRRQEIRSWIREKMNSGDLPTAIEENMNSKVAGISGGNLQEPERSGDQKRKDKKRDEIEEDPFFGDDEEESSDE
ncbi:hypothetical protein F5887DRAFT_981068 [Amanita rubescens]|nr:hypothetical protein F5887DRAFT_981068 [Amanita rubescens]